MPTVARGEVTFSPWSQTVPLSGFSNPATSLVTVDLPHPDGPTMAVKPFSGTPSVKSSKTWRLPEFVAKVCETPSMTIRSLSCDVFIY